jgi:hypothetical protein
MTDCGDALGRLGVLIAKHGAHASFERLKEVSSTSLQGVGVERELPV